jgi:hypothetical protein
MEDACRPDSFKESDVGAYFDDDEEKPAEDGMIRVGRKMRLDFAGSIFARRQPVHLHRKHDYRPFMNPHPKALLYRSPHPKLIAASEARIGCLYFGLFRLKRRLAMSPQLHKQMGSGGMLRLRKSYWSCSRRKKLKHEASLV